MAYPMANGMMGSPAPSNNYWLGNNYSSGYSQASRSSMGQPYYNQAGMSIQQPAPQEAPTVNNVIQAMGPEAANDYRVGPNSHAIMLDPGRPVMYIKHTDDTGHGVTKAYEYHEIPLFPQEQQPQINPDDFATKQDIETLAREVAGLKKFMEELRNNG